MVQLLLGTKMNINIDKINQNRKNRINKIETYALANKVPNFVAAMYIDEHSQLTTNKKMLNSVDYVIDTVTTDNYRDVISALAQIGVVVVYSESESDSYIANALNNVINEEIPECWGGPDMQEYVDITPSQV